MRHAKNILDREADARFWAQTGYKVGRKLDPTDPNDRHMVQVWIDVRRKVEAEDAAGRLRTTYASSRRPWPTSRRLGCSSCCRTARRCSSSS